MKPFESVGMTALLLVVGGCGSQIATASFPQTTMPVLLGPVDRIGGGAPMQIVGEEYFAGSSLAFVSTSTTDNGTTRTTTVRRETRGPGYLAEKLRLEFEARPNWDMRVTRLTANGECAMMDSVQSAYVYVKGNIVAVKKGGK